jgi:hypothetical protein
VAQKSAGSASGSRSLIRRKTVVEGHLDLSETFGAAERGAREEAFGQDQQ